MSREAIFCHDQLIADGWDYSKEVHKPTNPEHHSDTNYHYSKLMDGYAITFTENHNMAGGHAKCRIWVDGYWKDKAQTVFLYVPSMEFHMSSIGAWENVQEIVKKAPGIVAFLKSQTLTT